MYFQWKPAQKIALGYAVIAFLGGALLMLPFAHKASVNFIDALFSAASASYVTGLTTVSTAATWTPFGDAILALLMQVGGWGITLIATLAYLVLGRKITIGERLFFAEDKNWRVHGIVRLMKSIFYYSLWIEGVAAALFALYFHFKFDYPWLKAIGYATFHSVSAFNNAGFDLWGNSLEDFTGDAFMLILTSLLIILGGLGFVVLVEIYSYQQTRKFTLHTRIVLIMTGILLLAGVGVFLVFEADHSMAQLSWPDKILNAWFQSVTLRTAGYDSVPFGNMREVTWFLSVLFMFIGASPGSTGGGIKTTTFYMLIKSTMATIRGRNDIVSDERTIPWDVARKSTVIFMLATAFIIVAVLLCVIFEPHIDFMRIMFEVVSAFGTVGLTTGITGNIGDPMKWVLIVTMYIGRIGILTFLVSLSRQKRPVARYLEEKILIG